MSQHDNSSIVSDSTSQLLIYDTNRNYDLHLLRQSILSTPFMEEEVSPLMSSPFEINASRRPAHQEINQYNNNHDKSDQYNDVISLVSAMNDDITPDDSVSQVADVYNEHSLMEQNRSFKHNPNSQRATKHPDYLSHSVHSSHSSLSDQRLYESKKLSNAPRESYQYVSKAANKSIPVVNNHLENLKELTDRIHQRAINNARKKNIDIESIVSSSRSTNRFDDDNSSDEFSVNSMATSALLNALPGFHSHSPRYSNHSNPSIQSNQVKKHSSRGDQVFVSHKPKIQLKTEEKLNSRSGQKNDKHAHRRSNYDTFSEVSDQTNFLLRELDDFVHHRHTAKELNRSSNQNLTHHRSSSQPKKSNNDLQIKPQFRNLPVVAASIVSDATSELIYYGRQKNNSHSRSKSTNKNIRNVSKSSTIPRKSRDPVQDLYKQVQKSLKHPAFSNHSYTQSMISTISDDTRDLIGKHGINRHNQHYTTNSINTTNTINTTNKRKNFDSFDSSMSTEEVLNAVTKGEMKHDKSKNQQVNQNDSIPYDLIEKIKEWPGWKSYIQSQGSNELSNVNYEHNTVKPNHRNGSVIESDVGTKNIPQSSDTHYEANYRLNERNRYSFESDSIHQIDESSPTKRISIREPYTTKSKSLSNQDTSLFSEIETPRLNISHPTPSTIRPVLKEQIFPTSEFDTSPQYLSNQTSNTSSHLHSHHSLHVQHSNVHPQLERHHNSIKTDQRESGHIPYSTSSQSQANTIELWKKNKIPSQTEDLPAPPPRLSGGIGKGPRAPLPNHTLNTTLIGNGVKQLPFKQEEVLHTNSSSTNDSLLRNSQMNIINGTPSSIQNSSSTSSSTPTNIHQMVLNSSSSTDSQQNIPSMQTNSSKTSSSMSSTIISTPHADIHTGIISNSETNHTPISIQLPDGQQSLIVQVDGQSSNDRKIEIKLKNQEQPNDSIVISKDNFSLLINEITKSEPIQEKPTSIAAPLREVLMKYQDSEEKSPKRVHFATGNQLAIKHSYDQIDVLVSSESDNNESDNNESGSDDEDSEENENKEYKKNDESDEEDEDESSSEDSDSSDDSVDDTVIISKEEQHEIIDSSSISTSESEKEQIQTNRISLVHESLQEKIQQSPQSRPFQVRHIDRNFRMHRRTSGANSSIEINDPVQLESSIKELASKNQLSEHQVNEISDNMESPRLDIVQDEESWIKQTGKDTNVIHEKLALAAHKL